MLVFQFEIDEVNLILKGLGELPVKDAMLITLKIEKEAQEQIDKQKAESDKKK